MAPDIRPEKVLPEVGIEFRIKQVDKYIDQEKGRSHHVYCGIQLKKVISHLPELLKYSHADHQGKESLHNAQQKETLGQKQGINKNIDDPQKHTKGKGDQLHPVKRGSQKFIEYGQRFFRGFNGTDVFLNGKILEL